MVACFRQVLIVGMSKVWVALLIPAAFLACCHQRGWICLPCQQERVNCQKCISFWGRRVAWENWTCPIWCLRHLDSAKSWPLVVRESIQLASWWCVIVRGCVCKEALRANKVSGRLCQRRKAFRILLYHRTHLGSRSWRWRIVGPHVGGSVCPKSWS